MNVFYKIHLQAFNLISIVLYHSGPTFGQVLYSCQDAFVFDASDYSGHLIRHLLDASEASPTKWFLQFWEKSKSGGLMSGLYGGWGSTCHPYFSKISDTAPEAWGCTLSCKMRTPAASMAGLFGESLDAKRLAETFCSMPLLQWTPEALYLLLSLHSCQKP